MLALRPPPDAVLVSGDLVDEPEPGSTSGCGNSSPRCQCSTELELVREPAAFALHVATNGEITTHFQPIG